MMLDRHGLQGHKAWFYFDDEYVCLGAGIRNTEGKAEVFTTLNQCNRDGKVQYMVNGKNTYSEEWFRADCHRLGASWTDRLRQSIAPSRIPDSLRHSIVQSEYQSRYPPATRRICLPDTSGNLDRINRRKICRRPADKDTCQYGKDTSRTPREAGNNGNHLLPARRTET